MRIQETLVTDKQIALELYFKNGRYRLPIQGKDYYFPTLKKVHEAFLNQNTYDTVKLTQNGKKSYLHLFMDEIEVFDTKKALRQRLSQDSQGMWAEIRNGQKHYYVEKRGWTSTAYEEITEKQCIEKLENTSTLTKALGIGLGILALLPGAIEFARHLPIGSKEAAMGLIALNQKSPGLGALGYSLLPTTTEAQALGTEFQINTYTTSDQQNPSVAPLSDGGFVVIWGSLGQDGDNLGIFGQRYDSRGVLAGGQFQVNTYTTSYQRYPSVSALNNGGFVVTWSSNLQDGDLTGIYGQLYDSSGVAVGTEFLINTSGAGGQSNPNVATLNDGSFVVIWESCCQNGNNYDIYGRRFDNSGVAIGTEFQVNSYTADGQRNSNVAPLNDGGFVVVWDSYGQDGDREGIYGQRYDNTGVAAGTELQINTYTTSQQIYASVAPLINGGFVVTWNSIGQDGDFDGIFGKLYNSSGSATGAEFQINTYTTNQQRNPSVAPLINGGFVVTWDSIDQDGSFDGIFGQRYDSSGAAAGTEFQVNTYTTNYQLDSQVASLNDGGFIVTWESYLQDGDGYGIYGQRFDASGNPIPLQIPTSTTSIPSATQGSPSQNTPTTASLTTQSGLSGSIALPSNTSSPTQRISSIPSSSTLVSPTPTPTPNGSTALPSNTSSLSQLTSRMPGSTTISSAGPTTNSVATVTRQSTFTSSATASSTKASRTIAIPGSSLTPSIVSSATRGSSTQAAVSTASSRAATMATSSTLVIPSVENIVYGQNYPIIVNDQNVGTYTVSGGSGLLDSVGVSVISFDFDPSFQPQEGDILTLFYIPEEDVGLWQSIEIEGESFECLTTYGQIATNDGLSSFQVFFEDTECLAIAPTFLANALPLTLN